jgi:hypothetical protein
MGALVVAGVSAGLVATQATAHPLALVPLLVVALIGLQWTRSSHAWMSSAKCMADVHDVRGPSWEGRGVRRPPATRPVAQADDMPPNGV